MRLIDADKIGLTDFEIIMCNGDYKEALKMILDKIEKTPTVDVLGQIRTEIVEEQSCWREDTDAEWHECRRILRIIDTYKGD